MIKDTDIKDLELIKISEVKELKKLLQKDNIYRNSLFRKTLDKWKPNLDTHIFFECKKGKKSLGVLFIHNMFDGIAFHGGLYKRYRGRNTSKLLAGYLYLLKQLAYCPFYTTIAEDNIAAIKLVESVGFEKHGSATINKIPLILFRERQ